MTKLGRIQKSKKALTTLGRVSKETKGWTGPSSDWAFLRGDQP